jgi:hypothetical protein
MGRELQLTDQTQATIVQAIASAAPLETCARYAGIDRTTFWRWMELGKPDEPCVPADNREHLTPCPTADHGPGACPQLARYRDFRDAVERAQDALRISLAGQIVRAAPRDWKAALEVLRRPHVQGREWNVAQRTELGGTLEIEVSLSARERVRGKLDELHARGTIVALPAPTEKTEEDTDERATAGDRGPADERGDRRPRERRADRARPAPKRPRTIVA